MQSCWIIEQAKRKSFQHVFEAIVEFQASENLIEFVQQRFEGKQDAPLPSLSHTGARIKIPFVVFSLFRIMGYCAKTSS